MKIKHKLSRIPVRPWGRQKEIRAERRAAGRPGWMRPSLTLAEWAEWVERMRADGVPDYATVRMYFLTVGFPGAVIEWEDEDPTREDTDGNTG